MRYSQHLRRLLVLVLAAASAGSARAQADDYYGPYTFEAGSTARVFSDTAFLRESPGGAILDTLYAFSSVQVTGRSNPVHTVGRKAAPWYAVKVAGSGRTGYVWGGIGAGRVGKGRRYVSVRIAELSATHTRLGQRDRL